MILRLLALVWLLQNPAPPDVVFHNGKVVTVDAEFSIRQAFALQGDKFVAVGTNQEILALAGPKTRIVDLQGRTVIPGLMDNHNHQYRAASTTMRGLNMAGVPSLAEMMNRITAAVKTAPAGRAVLVGGGWQPRNFPENRAPTRSDLDGASPSHAVVVIRGRNQILLNSAALKAAGITRATNAVAGIPIPKDASGEPTGVIDEAPAVNEVTARLIPPNDDEKKELILTTQKQQNELGLTSIRELALDPDIMRIYWELWREGKLTLRVSMGMNTLVRDLDRIEEMLRFSGVGPGFGDHWLRLDCLAEFGIDTGTDVALVRQPLEGQHENPSGVATMTPEKLREAVLVMHKYGWRPSPHIVGDRALDMALDAYEAADRISPLKSRRWVVEHAELIHPDQMERMAKMGILLSAQIQPYRDARSMIENWGKDRAERAVP